jgi:hypothetical protein
VIVVIVVTLFFLRRRQKATLTSDEDTPEGQISLTADTAMTTYQETLTSDSVVMPLSIAGRNTLMTDLLDTDTL